MTRRRANKILRRADAERAAAEVAAEVITLTRTAMADRPYGWQELADARTLATILAGLTSYVAMFEKGS